MGEQQVQARKAVEDPAEDQSRENQGPLGEIAHCVAQLVALDPLLDRGASALMEEEEGTELLDSLEEGEELRLVVGPTEDVVVDDGASPARRWRSGCPASAGWPIP
jgi:hypothetical protein